MEEQITPKPSGEKSDDLFENKNLYRRRRNDFRGNKDAMTELGHWKARDNNFDYNHLTGLVPPNHIDREIPGRKPFAKSDTVFSEWEEHNLDRLVLSKSASSLIIGNLASYDSRQYPGWLDPSYMPGINTPEGQSFGHILIIPYQRIFNVVDPDAVKDDAAVLKEMTAHFTAFWNSGGNLVALQAARFSFDKQNSVLAAKEGLINQYFTLLPRLEADFGKLAEEYFTLKVDDFAFTVHAYPDISVGHLHMHVFPVKDSLRRFSARQHDWKNISIQSVLEVEAEDRESAI